jgi:hypothetical protein
LKSYARNNQEIELSYEGHAYTIENDRLQSVDLSDDAINAGEWTDTDKDTRIRYYINEAGIIQIKAFGFRKDLKLTDGKTANLPELASHIKEQTNRFLEENHVDRFDSEAPVFKDNGETFADGQLIIIGGNKSTFLKIISEGVGITTTLLKTGEVEEQVYLVGSRETATIFAPGALTGGFEVIAQKVTDITSLGSLVYDLAVDKDVRTETYRQLKGIKDEIADDPASFLPIFGEIVLTVTTGNTTEDIQAIFDENADSGKRSHLATRGTGNAIVTVMSGAALIKDLPEIGDKLTDWVKIISKSRREIRKILTTAEGMEYLRKYFSSKVNVGSFEEWFDKVKNFELDRDLNFEVRHIFPVNILENNQELQRILNKFNFDFNGVDNAIPLQKKSLKFDRTGHANHPQYDRLMEQKINNILLEVVDGNDAFEKIKELIGNTKKKLETDVLLGDKNVNSIIL